MFLSNTIPPLGVLLGFGFLSPWLFGFFIFTAAAPVVIHLLNRLKYREVTWAAMEYLLAAIQKSTRRLRIEQIILLLVRTAILVCLALAVGEPFFEQLGSAVGGSRRVHRLIVLDASYSMAYRRADRSRFERARELIAQIVEESNIGDGFTLVLLADPPRVVVGTPVFDRRDFLEEVGNVRLIHGGGDLSQTLSRVDELLKSVRREQPKLTSHEVYFLTDLGRNTWAPEHSTAAAKNAFRQRAKALSEQVALAVIDLGQPDADNLAVTAVRVAEPFAVAGRQVSVEADVRAFGRGRSGQLVEMLVDGKRAGETSVDLETSGSASVSFVHDFDAPGDHDVEIRLALDALEIDNRRWISVPVKASLKVLCVSGQTTSLGRRATDYVQAALAHQKDTQRAVIHVDAAAESAITDRELAQYDAIFLCNVGQFNRGEADQLHKYVQRGGGLVIFLGDNVQPESYNDRLLGKLLPARLGAVVTLNPAERQYVFDPLEYAHSIVAPFKGNEQVRLRETPVYRYFRLEVPEEPPKGRHPARVALAFTGGDPVIVEEKVGRGRSILVATSAGDDTNKPDPWNYMQVHGNFVVLVHGILGAAVAGQLERRNLVVGEPLGGTLGLEDVEGRVKIRTPWNAVEQAIIRAEGDQGAWNFAETDEGGIYAAELPANAPSPNMTFAVNVDTKESDLARIEPEELRGDLWKDVPLAVRTQWQNLEEQTAAPIAQRNFLHWWLLAATACLLLVEVVLAWFFGRHA
ncbi:MAG: VWA domain-containing protein [Planctomycetia bacterium]|nr:VWA domain-containing protein [Planctomycetia bacterium]